MKTYAFIDAQNTASTTEQLLGFIADWKKLFLFLKNEWRCEKIFFYSGIDAGDVDTEKEFDELRRSGCIVRDKVVFAYKNKDRKVQVKCPKCANKFLQNIDMGYNHKSNCDVDLTIDAMECAEKNVEFYIFTGDGDFEFLVKKAVEKGAIVHLVSSAKKIRTGPNYFTSRFSTKLRRLIDEKGKPVDFLNIDNLKMRIKKDE